MHSTGAIFISKYFFPCVGLALHKPIADPPLSIASLLRRTHTQTHTSSCPIADRIVRGLHDTQDHLRGGVCSLLLMLPSFPVPISSYSLSALFMLHVAKSPPTPTTFTFSSLAPSPAPPPSPSIPTSPTSTSSHPSPSVPYVVVGTSSRRPWPLLCHTRRPGARPMLRCSLGSSHPRLKESLARQPGLPNWDHRLVTVDAIPAHTPRSSLLRSSRQNTASATW